MYRWVDKEVLGTSFLIDSKYLQSLRSEVLMTPLGEMEEQYMFELGGEYERVCYIKHFDSPQWIWIHVTLFMHLRVQLPLPNFFFCNETLP